ncbi:hypothetical protein PLICRDRAFT_171621 [Plicaturopsis crispa FD-325 SS-3]|nr:hypothetical protein PLICRDRAFT_171621 [Plicaturopsis crispa FD-325 SS-3]
MRQILTVWFAAVLSLSGYVSAQTLTVTDPNSGATIVEVVTVDPVAGVATTETISTLISTSTPTTTTAATEQPVVNAGPVGQPAATTGTGVTIYTYTTTDANGVTTAVVDTFTPTYPPTVAVTPTGTGTVLPYSQWLSMVGTNTVAANAVSAGERRWRVERSAVGVSIGVLVGIGSGAWLALA